MSGDFLGFLSAALTGGVIVKLLDIVYAEFQRRNDRAQTAKQFVDENLDPVLKAAGELVQKIYALARQDFVPLRSLDGGSDPAEDHALGGLMFLFTRFWCRVEILKLKSIAVELSSDPRGRRLTSFFNCLEAKPVCIVNRTLQRAVAETLIDVKKPDYSTLRYIDFAQAAAQDGAMACWVEPLRQILVLGWHRGRKQHLLQYAVILHAMLNTLDPEGAVVNDEKWPSAANKLSRKTRSHLRFCIFKEYLAFVKTPGKYLNARTKPASSGLIYGG
jgi:hypothetical protein